MSLLNIVLLGFVLSIDAAAVAAVNGAQYRHLPLKISLRTALCFSLFHFVMPVVGWLLGVRLEHIISSYDHWIAFVLLVGIGIKMILESFKPIEQKDVDLYNIKILFLLSVALSIDALIIGMTFAFVPVNLLQAASIIGLINFAVSFMALYLGRKFGNLLEKKSEIIGGIILILIGLQTIFNHIYK